MSENASSRRDFLKVAVGSTLSAGVAPSAFAAPDPRPVPPSDAIRVATIGMGGMG